MTDLGRKIEAVLFYKAEPLTYTALAKMVGISKEDARAEVRKLGEELGERGIVVLEGEEEVSLGTHPETSELIQALAKEEREGPLTKSALETLSIILYQGPLTKPDIDYIRGVNSQFILRSLSVRGLVDRKPNPKDSRTYIYEPSLELFAHLGVRRAADLPEYEEYRKTLTGALLNKPKNDEE